MIISLAKKYSISHSPCKRSNMEQNSSPTLISPLPLIGRSPSKFYHQHIVQQNDAIEIVSSGSLSTKNHENIQMHIHQKIIDQINEKYQMNSDTHNIFPLHKSSIDDAVCRLSLDAEDLNTPKSDSTMDSNQDEEEQQKQGRSIFKRVKNLLNAKQKLFFINTLNFTLQYLIPSYRKQSITSVISSISYKTFQKCIGGDIEKVIKANEDSHEKKMANLEDKKDYSHIKLDHLIFIKKLGFGQFGSVYLVRNKDTGALYALKSVSKAQIIEQNLEKHLLQEKQVLETVNFTFVMQFIRTFKDNQSVYFLVEFISGMELFDVIRDIGLLSTQDSQFYIGTLILCMEYLHSRNIIYRDIKPENIMVDSKGYMYMIDMGTAKILKQEKHPGRTFTIIGTPHYMAPEIIQGKGYSYNADLWSVGICLYEFLCGGVPYAEEAEDPYEIYEEIIKKNNVKYPSFLKDKKAKRLIDQLLSKVPELRLGGSFAALKAHPWFDNFSWDELYNKTMKPPFIPPENKIIHDKEIMDMAKQGRLVINEIKHEQEKGKEYNKERARDPNWDKDF